MNKTPKSTLRILHIANDYAGSTVYKSLFSELDRNNLEQIVYTAVRSKKLIGNNEVAFKQKKSRLIYSNILNAFTRIFFHCKITRVVQDLEQKLDLTNVDVIHAHTWYSDGGVAYVLSKKYNLPYIVTVRSSDTEIFFKYMIHLRRYGKKVLLGAKNIVFVAPVYAKRLLNHPYYRNYQAFLTKNHSIIPNGIDDFWFKNIANEKRKISDETKLVYVGTFLKRKNVLKVIAATEELRKGGMNVSLSLVGGGGADHNRIMNFINEKAHYTYLGKIKDKEKLKEILRASDILVMPSERETFGLVYLEALSQCVPIIYSTDDGVDGLFGKEVGIAVSKKNLKLALPKAISTIAADLPKYTFSPKQVLTGYGWSELAGEYLKLYHNSIK
ncbi:glycosyltransferase family 4 protein [Parapedobacter sp. ISTM3]|uniref:glycosyltransferase family 4 protein n=1 Tax=Parapedobacter sp. ISTM3 TaxID=2800130 RepID=UPI001908D2BF|nr:glycosyltransferase family 4 protein [Parapedobacter sp. ISTM3]MBK1438356.1 glycosyltransferase family 4 protein [Parapedobacter sp. ISTM3]